jgi:hypothetical protein
LHVSLFLNGSRGCTWQCFRRLLVTSAASRCLCDGQAGGREWIEVGRPDVVSGDDAFGFNYSRLQVPMRDARLQSVEVIGNLFWICRVVRNHGLHTPPRVASALLWRSQSTSAYLFQLKRSFVRPGTQRSKNLTIEKEHLSPNPERNVASISSCLQAQTCDLP